MSKFEFIIEVIRSATIIILILDVAVANRGYRKLKSKDEKYQQENEKLKSDITELEKRIVFLEKQLWGANSNAYEAIKNNQNLNEAEKQEALHKLYMDNYSDANR